MHITVHGLVLREVEYKESDKLLTVLTREEGKLTVKARGCRKKASALAACAQLLVYSEMTLYEYRDFVQMSAAESLAQFWGVKGDIDKLALGSYFAETMEAAAVEGRAEPELLSLILNALHVLDQRDKPLAQVKAVYELSLLCLGGYEPMLDACAVCGAEEPSEPQFSLRDGVLHCAHCRAGVPGQISMPLCPASLAAMRHVAYGNPKRLFSFALPPEPMARFANVCEAFLLTQMERGFRTLDFYKATRKSVYPG
ncbi:MAG: DNA repair protein RecO [Oscillospiraceae bacterium]|nr:DNA repair protein RecO [Oscillospiraceae bacterium]